MGMFDTLVLHETWIDELPEWNRQDKYAERWQTKSLNPLMDTYKLSESGRLLREVEYTREMSDEEKLEEAEKYGFNSWEELTEVHSQAIEEGGFSAFEECSNTDEKLPVKLNDRTVDEIEWIDQEYHGSFEFHTAIHGDPVNDDLPPEYEWKEYWSYEVRFNSGEFKEFLHLETNDIT